MASVPYPPYHDPALENCGFQEELVRAAFKRSGYEIKVNYRPWTRVVQETKDGKHDGILGLWFREDRLRNFAYSEPIGVDKLVFCKLRDRQIVFNKYDDLRSFTIGVVRGYENPPEFKKAEYLKKEIVGPDFINQIKLLRKRIDLVIIDKAVGEYLIHKEFSDTDKLEWLEPVLKEDIQYIGFSKQKSYCQRHLDAFNAGLKKIKEDGTYEKILSDYGITE